MAAQPTTSRRSGGSSWTPSLPLRELRAWLNREAGLGRILADVTTGTDAIRATATEVSGDAITGGRGTSGSRAKGAIAGRGAQARDAAAKRTRGDAATRAGSAQPGRAAGTRRASKGAGLPGTVAGARPTTRGMTDAPAGKARNARPGRAAGLRRATRRARIRAKMLASVGVATTAAVSVAMIVGIRVDLTSVGHVRRASGKTGGPAATTEHRGTVRNATTERRVATLSATRGQITDGALVRVSGAETPSVGRVSSARGPAVPGGATIIAPSPRRGPLSRVPPQLRMSRRRPRRATTSRCCRWASGRNSRACRRI